MTPMISHGTFAVRIDPVRCEMARLESRRRCEVDSHQTELELKRLVCLIRIISWGSEESPKMLHRPIEPTGDSVKQEESRGGGGRTFR